MQIITLTEKEFDDFAKKNEYTSYYQSSHYANLEKQLDRYNIHYLGFENDGVLVGAALMLYKETILGYKFAYSPRGFLIDYADFNMVSTVTKGIIKLLKKQKFMFIKINPPVIARVEDFDHKTITENENIDELKKVLKNLNYQVAPNPRLPRNNIFAKLDKDNDKMFYSLSKENQSKIEHGREKSLILRLNPEDGLDRYEKLVVGKAKDKVINYYKTLYKDFREKNAVDLFILHIDTNHYGMNINKIYNKEYEKNLSLRKIIESGDRDRYNIEMVIEDKMTSDKNLANLEMEVRNSTPLVKKYPNGIDVGICMVAKQGHGVEVVTNYMSPEFANLNAEPFFYFEIMKYYAAQDYQYINLGPAIPKNNKYPTNKQGLNSSIYNYIGEYDLVINPLLYRIYLKDLKK